MGNASSNATTVTMDEYISDRPKYFPFWLSASA
jgi:hypothetical protein